MRTFFGTLKKKNSAGRWQTRFFEIRGPYWVYFKNAESNTMLCAMDLRTASAPTLLEPSEGETARCQFSIHWDRYRVFRAATEDETVRWVNAILQAQTNAANAAAIHNAPEAAMALTGPPTPSLRHLSRAGKAEAAATAAAAASAASSTADSARATEQGSKKRCACCTIM